MGQKHTHCFIKLKGWDFNSVWPPVKFGSLWNIPRGRRYTHEGATSGSLGALLPKGRPRTRNALKPSSVAVKHSRKQQMKSQWKQIGRKHFSLKNLNLDISSENLNKEKHLKILKIIEICCIKKMCCKLNTIDTYYYS